MDLSQAAAAAVAPALVAFALSVAQALIASKAGSDHPAHVFLRNAIRRNGHRLFTRIPGLLNVCHCAAIPLYIHWLLSLLPARAVYWSERLLNPVVNALHVAVFAVIAAPVAGAAGWSPWTLAAAVFVFALTPQLLHALSARNFGLSARGTGLLLLSLFFYTAYGISESSQPGALWLVLALLGWLVWGFSTFAQQAMVILSVLLFVLTGRYVPLIGVVLGLVVFIAMHRAYSVSYLVHTLKFLRAYAKELAPVYILNRRPSIWRDLVRDLWLRWREGPMRAALYAYENSVLIVLLLNPLVLVGAVATWGRGGIIGFAGALALCGITAAVITSFRPTRFLGEPERYVEAVTPWGTLAGAIVLVEQVGPAALVVVAAAFAAVDMLQLLASRILMRHMAPVTGELERIEAVIRDAFGEDTRLCSNNEQLTKMFMANPWRFSYFWAVGQVYAGMSATEAFSPFPILRRTACARIAETYRVNVCLLERKHYDTLFDAPPAMLRRTRVLYESDRFRLLALDWVSAAT